MKLNLRYPINTYYLYQKFGADEACYRASDKSVVSKQNGVCPQGYVSLYAASGMKGHNGMDMWGQHGEPIYHAGPDGFVEEVQSEADRGLGLGIVTNDRYEVEGGAFQIKLRYWHLKDFNVGYDDVVKTGDLIGWADNTGYSSGDHLHFEIKPVVKNSKGSYYNEFQSNGYYGAINPEPYFDGLYAQKKFYFAKNLKMGDKNDDVKELQIELKKLGHFTYPEITGYYGSVTRKAVYEFQKANNISVTSSLFGLYTGPATRAVLNYGII